MHPPRQYYSRTEVQWFYGNVVWWSEPSYLGLTAPDMISCLCQFHMLRASTQVRKYVSTVIIPRILPQLEPGRHGRALDVVSGTKNGDKQLLPYGTSWDSQITSTVRYGTAGTYRLRHKLVPYHW